LNVFADFKPKLPSNYQEQPYLMLGNIQPSLQRNVKTQMKDAKLVGGDTMNYWISDFRDELLHTIKDWDFLLINDSEATQLSGQSYLVRAAKCILGMGPRSLIIKRGEYGATLFSDEHFFAVPGFMLDHLFDPTGAGDCFAGGFIGYLAEQGVDPTSGAIDPMILRRAVVYGSVMGSFCCEAFGPERFKTLTREHIDQRFQDFQNFTKF